MQPSTPVSWTNGLVDLVSSRAVSTTSSLGWYLYILARENEILSSDRGGPEWTEPPNVDLVGVYASAVPQ